MLDAGRQNAQLLNYLSALLGLLATYSETSTQDGEVKRDGRGRRQVGVSSAKYQHLCGIQSIYDGGGSCEG